MLAWVASAVVNAWGVLQASPINPGTHSITSPSGTQAREIEWLYWLIFWIAFTAFVLVILSFAGASAKAYVNDPEPLPVIKNEEADRRAGWAVGIAIAATVVGLF